MSKEVSLSALRIQALEREAVRLREEIEGRGGWRSLMRTLRSSLSDYEAREQAYRLLLGRPQTSDEKKLARKGLRLIDNPGMMKLGGGHVERRCSCFPSTDERTTDNDPTH